MKKKEYRKIIVELTKMNKALEESNKALKLQCLKLNRQNSVNKRARLRIIGSLSQLSNELGAECMIPESEVVQKCIEAVKKAYV